MDNTMITLGSLPKVSLPQAGIRRVKIAGGVEEAPPPAMPEYIQGDNTIRNVAYDGYTCRSEDGFSRLKQYEANDNQWWENIPYFNDFTKLPFESSEAINVKVKDGLRIEFSRTYIEQSVGKYADYCFSLDKAIIEQDMAMLPIFVPKEGPCIVFAVGNGTWRLCVENNWKNNGFGGIIVSPNAPTWDDLPITKKFCVSICSDGYVVVNGQIFPYDKTKMAGGYYETENADGIWFSPNQSMHQNACVTTLHAFRSYASILDYPSSDAIANQRLDAARFGIRMLG